MKKLNFLCILTAFALVFSLAVPVAFADNADSAADDALIAVDEAIVNGADETYYNNGEVVFNNGGTVFNNGGTVFNNGGVVFNNEGVVYNNGGTVYNNSGTVHNNSGHVEDNSVAAAAVTGADKLSGTDKSEKADKAEKTDKAAKSEPAEDKKSEHTVTFAGDYMRFIEVSTGGDVGAVTLTADDVITITPNEGVAVTDAVTTAGACTVDDDGVITLQKVDRDGTLTLKFKLDAPTITPDAGAYGDDVLVTLSAPYRYADIYYTLDGTTPTTESTPYTKPFEIDSSCVLKVIAAEDTATSSDVVEASYSFPVVLDVEFASAQVGYKEVSAKPVTVKNTGLGTLKITAAALAGEDKDAFTLSTEKGGTVATGQSNTKTWTVAPKTGLAAGEYEAQVVFTLDSGDTVDADISFTVTKPSTKKA